MTWIITGVVILIGLFLSGLFSGSETGLYCVNRLRIELGVRDRDARSLRLDRVLSDEQGALSVALVGTNIANYVTTTAVAFLFAELMGLPDTHAEVYTIVLVTPVVFVFGEVVPKNLFQLHADHWMAIASGLLSIADRLFRATGVVWLLKLLAAGVNRVAGSIDKDVIATPRRRIAALLQEALADSTFGVEQSELVDRVCRLSERPLHAAMMPHNRVTMISANADRKELLRVARRTGHARLPVFETRPVHVVGLINVDELLRTEDWQTVSERIDSVPRLSPHSTIASAIRTLQDSRKHLAVVTDAGGRMLGIVTLTDLLEELVG